MSPEKRPMTHSWQVWEIRKMSQITWGYRIVLKKFGNAIMNIRLNWGNYFSSQLVIPNSRSRYLVRSSDMRKPIILSRVFEMIKLNKNKAGCSSQFPGLLFRICCFLLQSPLHNYSQMSVVHFSEKSFTNSYRNLKTISLRTSSHFSDLLNNCDET